MKDDFFRQYQFLCHEASINPSTQVERCEAEALEFISPYRLDFMSKLLWIESTEGKFDRDVAEKLYEAHLLAFSNYVMIEPGQPEKKGLERYLDTFNKICKATRLTEGDLVSIGYPIPIDEKNMAMDGAHRICAAIYYKKRIPVYLVHMEVPNKYDYRFFRSRFLREDYILMMVKKYISLRECRLYIIHKEQIHMERDKLYGELVPLYMRELRTGELFLIFDMFWMRQEGKEKMLLECLGDYFTEGTDSIIHQINQKENELLIYEIGYEWKRKIGIFYGMCCAYFKVWIKRLLGRLV